MLRRRYEMQFITSLDQVFESFVTTIFHKQSYTLNKILLFK